MKRNLLMLLFAMLIGVFTSAAQDVTMTIYIDNPAMAAVTVNGPTPYGQPVDLIEGNNRVTLPASRPLFVSPQNGATLKVTVNGGDPLGILGSGESMYYQTLVEQGIFVQITSEGGVIKPPTIPTPITLNNPGSAELIYGDEKFDIVSNDEYPILKDEWATIAPKEGWTIKNCSFGSAFSNDKWIQNSDGTYSFTPVQYGNIFVETKLKGIDFSVNVNVSNNVIVNAFDKDGQDLGEVNLENEASPYFGTASLSATDLSFTAVEGGKILSITRIDANGQRTPLADGNLSEGGWRSAVAEGDTFEIECVGPEAQIKFTGYLIDELWERINPADAFVVTVAGQPVELTKDAAECFVAAHIGDEITATTRRGYTLLSPGGIEGITYIPVVNEGAVQSGIIAGTAGIVLNSVPFIQKVINIDHVEGVTIQGNFGTGEVLELKDGENVFENVPNPLKITANEGWMILSVILDGEEVRPQGGAYTASLENGSILNITTRETDKPFPVTISCIGNGGNRDNLVVTQNGEVVNPDAILSAMNFTSITIAAKPGYIIKELKDFQGNSVSYNAQTNVYTIFFTNAASMISVEFDEPKDGELFVGFECPDEGYCLAVYDKEGNFIPNIMGEGLWYVWPGLTAKVPAGSSVKVATFTGYSCLESVTVNGVTTDYDVEDFVRTSELIKLETERTAISATVAYPEFPILLSGSESLETVYGSGAVIGTIYLNKVGTLKATAWPGEVVKVYPVPAKGYIFDKFSYFDGENEIEYPFEIEGPAEDGSYSFTIPLDYVAENIYMRGFFVPDPENPSYLVIGDRVYANTDNDEDDLLVGYVAVNGGSDFFAFPGEKVLLGFYQDPETLEDYHAKYFCSYATPDVALPVETGADGMPYYTVNPEDTAFSNVIMISVKLGEGSGVDGVVVDSDFNYDAVSGIVCSSTDVKVYNAAGQLVRILSAGDNSLENLPAGVYFLSNGVKTLKIAK